MFKKTLFAVCFLGIASSPVYSFPVTDPAQTNVITNILVTMTLQLMKIREILAQEQMQVSAVGKSDESVISSAQKIYEDQDKRPDIAQLTFPTVSSDLQSAVGGKDTKLSVQRVFKENYIRPETEELALKETPQASGCLWARSPPASRLSSRGAAPHGRLSSCEGPPRIPACPPHSSHGSPQGS